MDFQDAPLDPNLVAAIRRLRRDVSLGTLWWVSESFWEEKLPSGYSSDRDAHPGVSLWRQAHRDCLGAVPMLYGSSSRPRQNGDLACYARGLSPDYPVDHRTYFQTIAPDHMPVAAEGREFLTTWHSVARIWPNNHKDRLEMKELTPLKLWMEKRGLAT